MIAYMSVSSSAEPMPCTRRIAKQYAAKGRPAGTADAKAKQIDDTETVQRPQMYTQTLPCYDMSRPANGEQTKMTAAKMAKTRPTPSSLMPLAFAS